MRKWIWIAPLVLAAGCSRQTATPAAAPNAGPPIGSPLTAAPAPATPPGNSAARTADAEPVERPPVTDAGPVPAEPRRPEIRVPQGVSLRVRLDESVSTRKNRAGDSFSATLSRPVVVHGETVIPEGTRFHGHVTAAEASGRLKGRPVLALTLDSFHLGGREYRLLTSSVERVGPAHKKRNAFLIGGGAGLGAAIGAIAGGGKGALIGGLAGAGAGTAGAAATGKEQVTLAAETPLAFTTRSPIGM